MVQTGIFPHGILNEKGEPCRDYILHERTFRHTLELANDPGINKDLINNSTYYDAAIYAKRLKVAGIDNLTPDMVLDLDAEDGDELAEAVTQLEQRREEFRNSQQTPPKAADSPPETGGAME